MYHNCNIEFLSLSDFSDVRGSEPLDDLLASEQLQAAFRDGLGPIDFQTLDQEFLQLDPQVEDSFRLDRLWDPVEGGDEFWWVLEQEKLEAEAENKE
jgi:hypothetical protein